MAFFEKKLGKTWELGIWPGNSLGNEHFQKYMGFIKSIKKIACGGLLFNLQLYSLAKLLIHILLKPGKWLIIPKNLGIDHAKTWESTKNGHGNLGKTWD